MHIGEISKQSGISPRMIRHYEKLGLIPPANRQRSGYRNYSQDDVCRLRFIRSARDLGFPLAEIASLIEFWENPRRASREVKTLALARADALQQQARELEEMRRRLLSLAESCPGNSQPVCPILEEMAGVREPT